MSMMNVVTQGSTPSWQESYEPNMKTIKSNETVMYANQRPQIYSFQEDENHERGVIPNSTIIPRWTHSDNISSFFLSLAPSHRRRFRFQVRASSHIYLTFMISLKRFLLRAVQLVGTNFEYNLEKKFMGGWIEIVKRPSEDGG